MAGIYLHIPFCKQACTYCNFHFSTLPHQRKEMVEAIIREIELTPFFNVNEKNIETIYFGGGTPSILDCTDLEKIILTIKNKFIVDENSEITLEANPDDINENSLSEWKKIGINRLSVGIQSFDEEELKWMNRAHNSKESDQCLESIEQSGIENYSADLIYGSPFQSEDQLKKNISKLHQKKVPHISAYALTVENKTALHHQIEQKKIPEINAEHQAKMFEILVDELEKLGYEQYEISNFSLPKFRSKHNSSYWLGKAYYGFGPSAHAYDGKNIRQWNVANNSIYLKKISANILPKEVEVLSTENRINENIMIHLRLIEGLNLNEHKNLFGDAELQRLQKLAVRKIELGLLKIENDYLIITKAGKFLSDGIAADLFV